MNYSLKSFFPKNDDCTIHLLQSRNDNEKGQNVCFLINKKQSQYMCEIFDTNVLLKGLLDKQYQGDSIDSFLGFIGKKYEIGTNTFDLNVSDLVLCFKDHGFTLIDTKTPILDKPEQSGFSGSIYFLIMRYEPTILNLIVKIYLVEGIINQKDKEQEITLYAAGAKEIGLNTRRDYMWDCNLIVKGKKEKLPFRFIVMERFDITLKNYLYKTSAIVNEGIKNKMREERVEEFDNLRDPALTFLENEYALSDQFINALVDILLNMITHGILDNDLLLDNIGVIFDDGKEMKKFKRFAIINFGSAEMILEGKLFADPTKDMWSLLNDLTKVRFLLKHDIGFLWRTKKLDTFLYQSSQSQYFIKVNERRSRKF